MKRRSRCGWTRIVRGTNGKWHVVRFSVFNSSLYHFVSISGVFRLTMIDPHVTSSVISHSLKIYWRNCYRPLNKTISSLRRLQLGLIRYLKYLMKESWVLPWMMMMMMNTAVIMICNGLYHYSICLDHYSLLPWRCADLPILVQNAHLYRCAWCQAWKSPVCLRSLATIKPLLGCNGVLEHPIFVTKKIVVKMAYFQCRKYIISICRLFEGFRFEGTGTMQEL